MKLSEFSIYLLLTCFYNFRKMAPSAPEVKPVPSDDPIGIRAVLLGPPGSGKGTQVSLFYFMF